MKNSSPASTSLYPLEALKKIYREESLYRIDSEEYSTFADRKTSVAENASEQIAGKDSYDPTNDLILKPLKDRKIQNTIQQQKIRKLHAINIICAIVLIVPAVAFIISTVLASPFFAIGLALSVTVAVILLAISYCLMQNIDRCGIQKMCIDMLLTGIKNNIPDNNIPLEECIKLSNILEKVVSSDNKYELDLLNNVYGYYHFNYYVTTKQELADQIKNFHKLIFENVELTNHLEKLGFNVDAVQNDIYAHIENSTLYQLSEDIMENMLLR